jgi:hypothetical protein
MLIDSQQLSRLIVVSIWLKPNPSCQVRTNVTLLPCEVSTLFQVRAANDAHAI